MNRPLALTAVASLAALAAAQAVFRYTTPDISVLGSSGRVDFEADGTRVRAKGSPLRATSRTQGLELTAPSIDALLAPDAARRTRLKQAILNGSVKLNRKDPNGTLEADGSGATLKDIPNGLQIALGGPTAFRQSGVDGTSTVITGADATAIMGGLEDGKPALLRATVQGPVKITGRTPAAAGRAATRLEATGNQLTVDQTVVPGRVVLRGNVSVDAQGDGALDIRNAQAITLLLDAKGQISSIQLEGEPFDARLRSGGR